MNIDWSWRSPAAAHIEWYRRIVEEKAAKAQVAEAQVAGERSRTV
jgi:hypothetical protein